MAFGVPGTHADGAVLIFQGRVREVNEGRRVTRLHYEAYEEMATRELESICEEAADRFEIGEVSAAHRVGDLDPGDVSVVVAVAAPHRAAAYEASRFVIERLKERVPIWKRERYADGETSWLRSASGLSVGGGEDEGGGDGDAAPGGSR